MTVDLRNIQSYVINLDKNIEKYSEIKTKFKTLNITNIQRFSAIYGKDLDEKYIDNITNPYVQYIIHHGRFTDSDIGSYGAIGCYISHVKLWEMLLNVKQNQDMFLVLEDDAIPLEKYTIFDINNFINEVIENTKNWDIIYLGYAKRPRDNDIEITKNVYKIDSMVFQTHAYIINKKGITKLLKFALPMVFELDSFISFMSMYRNLNSYRSKDSYIVQSNVKSSDIHNTNKELKVYLNGIDTNNIKIILWMVFMILFLFVFFILLYFYKYIIKYFYKYYP